MRAFDSMSSEYRTIPLVVVRRLSVLSRPKFACSGPILRLLQQQAMGLSRISWLSAVVAQLEPRRPQFDEEIGASGAISN